MAGIRFSSNTNFEAFILISPVVWIVYIADRKMSKDTEENIVKLYTKYSRKKQEKSVFCFILAFDCSNTEYLE